MSRKVIDIMFDCFIVKEGDVFKAYKKKDLIINNGNAKAITQQPTVELVIEVLKSI